MRKHGKRISPPLATITAVQHVNLMLAPRIHLEMMLAGDVSRAFQHSVLGLLNLAMALAQLQNKPQIEQRYKAAQKLMIELIEKSRKPTQAEGDSLCESLNWADRHFGRQSKTDLVQAMALMDRIIADGNAVQGTSTG